MLWLLLACADPGPSGDGTSDTADTDVAFDDTYDVIVVGTGPAGTAAALTAQDAGARVLLLERDDVAGTGLILGGRAFAAGTRWQEEQGIVDSVDQARSEWEAITGVSGDLPGVVDFLENSADTLEWLTAHGMQVAHVGGDHDSGSVARIHDMDWTAGPTGLGDSLLTYFTGELRTGVEVTAPVMEGDAIVGVRWTDLATGMTGASGASAVVLATGGFLRDRDEVDRVAPSLAGRRLVFETNPTSDGGGLPFLQAVGAGSLSPEHIGIYVHSITDFGMGDGEALVAIGAENGIMVDAAGERFADETLQRSLDLFDQLPEGEVYAILPESVAPFVQFMRPYYNWSNPPNPEILPMSDVLGHADDVYSGASIEEVADAAGIDPVGLAATVEEWNAEVATGGPDPFGRDLATAHPMTGSQFVALRLTPGLAKAFGGVATDEEAHVLDASGTPIPGLYAAGEVAGMVLGGGGGHGFEGSVGACYWGGRVAGASAAAFAGP